jgi:hypothetical protein
MSVALPALYTMKHHNRFGTLRDVLFNGRGSPVPDAATRDPADPERLRPAFDSGDHLHPNDAGDKAMAAVVPLRRL